MLFNLTAVIYSYVNRFFKKYLTINTMSTTDAHLPQQEILQDKNIVHDEMQINFPASKSEQQKIRENPQQFVQPNRLMVKDLKV